MMFIMILVIMMLVVVSVVVHAVVLCGITNLMALRHLDLHLQCTGARLKMLFPEGTQALPRHEPFIIGSPRSPAITDKLLGVPHTRYHASCPNPGHGTFW